jgi:hypothetical protein
MPESRPFRSAPEKLAGWKRAGFVDFGKTTDGGTETGVDNMGGCLRGIIGCGGMGTVQHVEQSDGPALAARGGRLNALPACVSVYSPE